MSKERDVVIREAPLSNNCPECFNQDMTLRFSQRHRVSRLIHRVYGEVHRELRCNTCNNVIYPVSWTEDIERSVEYYEKLVEPKKATIRLKPLSYILMLLGVAAVAAVAYALLNGLI